VKLLNGTKNMIFYLAYLTVDYTLGIIPTQST